MIVIHQHKSQVPMVDLLNGCDSWEVKIGEHGSVSLVDMLPRIVPEGRTADSAIVRAARTSTGQGLKTPAEDRSLVRYMYAHHHSSPFEQVVFTFHMALPIFVARQMIRHRTARVNEFSMRYAEAKDRFWFPKAEDIRKQGTANKQGGDESMSLEDAQLFVDNLHYISEEAWTGYKSDIEHGVSRELARTQLPVNIFTEWTWQIDAGNLLKTLSLRQDSHAQAEIRDYAEAMYYLVRRLIPDSIEAYDDYNTNRNGMSLSAMEIELIKHSVNPTSLNDKLEELIKCGRLSQREAKEFKVKYERLQL